jgi:thioester reductase-like protein
LSFALTSQDSSRKLTEKKELEWLKAEACASSRVSCATHASSVLNCIKLVWCMRTKNHWHLDASSDNQLVKQKRDTAAAPGQLLPYHVWSHRDEF